MSLPLWAAELARIFWEKAREEEPFPRNLRKPIARAVPLSIVLLPQLSVHSALTWLRKTGVACELPGIDRTLRACLVARNGHGIAFLDGSDDEDEQRFSLAHELAHFLRDYWAPRQRIAKRLGPDTLRVVDGERPPTTQERVHSLLRYTPLGLQLHLLQRDMDGNPATLSIAQAENDADRLAYELLAPLERVVVEGDAADSRALTQRLQTLYGLPGVHARRYAGLLLPPLQSDPLLVRLRAVLKPH